MSGLCVWTMIVLTRPVQVPTAVMSLPLVQVAVVVALWRQLVKRIIQVQGNVRACCSDRDTDVFRKHTSEFKTGYGHKINCGTVVWS